MIQHAITEKVIRGHLRALEPAHALAEVAAALRSSQYHKLADDVLDGADPHKVLAFLEGEAAQPRGAYEPGDVADRVLLSYALTWVRAWCL